MSFPLLLQPKYPPSTGHLLVNWDKLNESYEMSTNIGTNIWTNIWTNYIHLNIVMNQPSNHLQSNVVSPGCWHIRTDVHASEQVFSIWIIWQFPTATLRALNNQPQQKKDGSLFENLVKNGYSQTKNQDLCWVFLGPNGIPQWLWPIPCPSSQIPTIATCPDSKRAVHPPHRGSNSRAVALANLWPVKDS